MHRQGKPLPWPQHSARRCEIHIEQDFPAMRRQCRVGGQASIAEKKYRRGEYSSMLRAVLWRGGSSGIEPVVGWPIDVDIGAMLRGIE